ncbi:MAG: lamin tail domain-containing protein [Phycisphaerae bacterium]|nr:lamin tail domain-containing protein [Phycisphaerae bacterium]
MLRRIRISLSTLLIAVFAAGAVNVHCPAGDLTGDWGQTAIPLTINEFMASNSNSVEDPQGDYDDWIEIHNFGADAIDVGGMYLTDDMSVPTKWRIPGNDPVSTIIPAGGYLVIWADNDIADAGLHANFKLDADGDEIGLIDGLGSTPIDSVVFAKQSSNISFGRFPDSGESQRFFPAPTPGTQNDGGYLGEVDAPEFSQKRGFYDQAFTATLATETEGAVIYYTLDGKEPYTLGGRMPSGTLYQGPISISRTTILRAKAIKAGYMPSRIKTNTYIFVRDVKRQSSSGSAPGPGWPSGSVNSQVINYGMDPDVVNDPRYAPLIEGALRAVPSISLVTELSNLFGASDGIYSHPSSEGRAWERPTSVELLNPDGSEGFQIDAGLRIRGGFSRSTSNPKHAFRLFFRAEYGDAKLRFPLFEDEGVDEFDNMDLRTSQNYSWSFQNDSQNTMVREVFSRDTQGQMGHPYTRSRYYHLYINGQYWGLYQTQERAEASYGQSYFGGDKDDYDAIKVDRAAGRAMVATDGNLDAYRRLYDAARAGLSNNEAYYRIQGMNPDGTRNPNYERLLDVDNLIDFMILEYYSGDRDGPGSRFGNIPNNTFSIYGRADPDGFKFFHHDNEHTLGTSNSEVNMVTPFTTAGAQLRYFNPHWLHEQLAGVNADYRMRFADRVYRHFFGDGLLTPGASQGRLQSRVDQIELAIVAESARWGDSKRSTPFTRDGHWRPEINKILNSYMPSRTNVVLDQFKSVGWYPGIQPPAFSHAGGRSNGGFNLTMSTPTGTIYYTLDGSDPRPTGTPQIQIDTGATLIAESAEKRVLVPIRSAGDSWKDCSGFSDRTWTRVSGNPGAVGYETATGYEHLLSLDIESQMYTRNATCYIRIPFTVSGNPEEFMLMTLNIRYDDGFVAYINGTEVARRNFSGRPAWSSAASASHPDSEAVQFESIDISMSLNLLQQGGNLLAIQGLNSSATSPDFLISTELLARAAEEDPSDDILPDPGKYAGPIALDISTHVKARVLRGRAWSALNEAVFAVGPVADNLRITEIMYYAPDPNEEFVELRNVGAQTINLNLVSFTDGIDLTFPSVELAAGEYVVVVRDIGTFEARYGTNVNVAGQYSGRLNDAGERIRLQDAIGQTILDFAYKNGWRSLTDGEGFSLTAIDPTNPDPDSWDRKDSWRASAYVGGSPGQDDSGIIPDPGAVVINELLAHSHDTASDWIELYNTTRDAIEVGGWFLSDSEDNLFKYQIAGGTIIGPGEYLVLYQDLNFGNANDAGSYEPFALSENGERLYLSSAQNGVLTGYRDVEDFGPSPTGVSFGRYYKPSTNNYNFVATDHITPGSANADPKVGPVVISEIMYNPDWPADGSYTNDQYEYIELHNIGAEPVTLYDFDKGAPWKLTDGIEFTFDADLPVTIAGGGRLVVARDPEALSWCYPGIPAEKILGPYDGRLSDAGESLELAMPGDVDASGQRFYVRVDRVNYSDGSHPDEAPGSVDLWPAEPDGAGGSLTRKVASDYGNDPDNWIASTPSPGE